MSGQAAAAMDAISRVVTEMCEIAGWTIEVVGVIVVADAEAGDVGVDITLNDKFGIDSADKIRDALHRAAIESTMSLLDDDTGRHDRRF